MATSSMQVQALLGSPVRSGRVTHYFPAVQVPGLGKQVRMAVGCRAEMKDQREEPTEPVTPAPAPAPKVSTKFSDVLAFGGPGPERINGRLAMIGFVAAMAIELSKGQDVFTQISNGGVTWFLGATLVISLASLIPLFKGVSVESKSQGLMTSDAELWNGRFAMLGLVGLAFTEFLKGGSLV